MRKHSTALVAFLFLVAGHLAFSTVPDAAGAPTVDDIRDQVLPALLMNEISVLHMAGLDAPAPIPIVDLAVTDLGVWGEPGCYELSFRVYWTATDDVYAKWIGPGPSLGEIWLIRCGRASARYAEKWVEISVERKTVPDEKGGMKTVYEWKRRASDGIGQIEWDIGIGSSFAATKACWEAQAAVTGETLKFFESPDQLPVR